MMDQSPERLAYMDQLDAAYQKLQEQYQNEIPDEVEREWNKTIDKKLTSRLDQALFKDIVDFYMEAIGK